MFYDDVFQSILASSPFSEKGILTVTSRTVVDGQSVTETSEYELSGFFCSGSYGQESFDKGYSVKKSVKRQSFKVSLKDLSVDVKKLARAKLAVHGKVWTVDEVTGNQSGILELTLK